MGLSTDPLSHAGWSVALVFLVAYVLRRALNQKNKEGDQALEQVHRGINWRIDYRLVIVGAILPDLLPA